MHIHILGICGTFMGGIAAIAKAAGHRVTGSDRNVYPPMSTQLAALGIDVFALRGALLWWPEGADLSEPPIPFLPPVIEESAERDGKKVLLINDGIHRVYAARKRGRKLNVVLARNVPAEYPYYAYALPDGWRQVEELAELTDSVPWKWWAKYQKFDEQNARVVCRQLGYSGGVHKELPQQPPPAASSEYDWLFDYMMSVFRSPTWEVPLMMFIDDNWCVDGGACSCNVSGVWWAAGPASGGVHPLPPVRF